MDALVTRLHEERNRIWEEAKALLDTKDPQSDEPEKRDLSAEEEAKWSELNGEIDKHDKRIKELLDAEERKRENDEARSRLENAARPNEPDEREKEKQDVEKRVVDWVKAQADDSQWSPRAIEFKITDADKRAAYAEVEKRTLSKLTAAAGGNTVPTDFRRQLYEHLVESSAIRLAGATVLTTDSGEALQIPKTTAHGSAALVAEAGTIPAGDATFGQITLDAFKYGKLTQVSNELITDNAVNLLDYLARDSGRALGDASGAHFITGTGSGQPNGVVTAITQIVTGPVGTSVSLGAQGTADMGGDALYNLIYTVPEPYRRRGVFLLRDATMKIIRVLKEATTNQYIFQPGLQAGQPDTILGYRFVTDPNVAAMAANAKSIVFGDFSAYYIRDVSGVRYERSDDFAFNQDLVTFRGLLRTDGDLVDTSALAVWKNAAT